MDTALRKLQLTQLEILKEIDSICRKWDIPYSLYAGTLLGAVRHKGFIPWDDDLDICMTRKNYNRFLQAWEQEAPAGYILQNKENSPQFTQSFTKIRKDHTTFLEVEWEKGRYHTGIFVDIFPIDRAPKGKLAQAMFRWDCMRYQLLTREFVPSKASFAATAVSRMMLACIPEHKRPAKRQKLLKSIARYQDRTDLPLIAVETVKTIKTLYPSDMLDAYVDLPFEGGMYQCIKQWDRNLRLKFGDYMKFPPESERTWTHHPVCVDFEHNYEELPSE